MNRHACLFRMPAPNPPHMASFYDSLRVSLDVIPALAERGDWLGVARELANIGYAGDRATKTILRAVEFKIVPKSDEVAANAEASGVHHSVLGTDSPADAVVPGASA